MSYQIYDNGASIRIVSDSGEKLIMKHQVVQLSVLSGSVIKIDQGDPLTTLYLNYADVTVPVAVSATALRDLLNTYVTNCVCASCSSGGGSAQLAANNGLSVENNAVVLGEALGSTLGAATFTTNRQIYTNGFFLNLRSPRVNNTSLSAIGIQIIGEYNTDSSTGPGLPAVIQMGCVTNGTTNYTDLIRRENGLYITPLKKKAPFIFQDNGKLVYSGADGTSLSDAAADFNCNTTAGFMKAVTHFSDDADVGESFTGNAVYTNLGATHPIILSLASTSIGSFFTFYTSEDTPFHIRTKSDTGTIVIADNETSEGYPITSNTAGSSVTLCLIAPDRWVAIAIVGKWIAETIPA